MNLMFIHFRVVKSMCPLFLSEGLSVVKFYFMFTTIWVFSILLNLFFNLRTRQPIIFSSAWFGYIELLFFGGQGQKRFQRVKELASYVLTGCISNINNCCGLRVDELRVAFLTSNIEFQTSIPAFLTSNILI